MKKNMLSWMTIALMVFVCAGFAACGGSDDDDTPGGGGNASPLVGTWSYTESGSDSDGTWQDTSTFVFNADGTGLSTSVGWASYRQQRQLHDYRESFNYSATMTGANTGILTVVYTSSDYHTIGKEYYWSFTISGNTLSINEGYDVGANYTETYTRR